MPEPNDPGGLQEVAPTPMSDFASNVITAGLPAYQEAGAKESAFLRSSAARERTEAADVKQTMDRQASEREAARPEAPTLPTPPDTSPRPFLSPSKTLLGQFQSAITGVTQMALGIGGLKGGGYAIAAVAGLKGALEGWAAGDHERAKASLRDWETNSAKLQADYRNKLERYREILTEQQTTMENRLALIGLQAKADGNEALANAVDKGDVKSVIDILQQHQTHLDTLGLRRDTLGAANKKHEEDLAEKIRHDKETETERARADQAREDQAKETLAAKVQADRDRADWMRENLNLKRDAQDEKTIKKASADQKHDAQVEVMQTALDQMKSLLPEMDRKKFLQQSIGPVGAGQRWLNTFMQSGDPTLAAWGQHAQTVIGFDRTIMNDLGRAQSAYAAGQAFITHPPTREGAELVIQRFQDLLNAEKRGRSGGAAAPKTPVLIGPDNTRYDGTGVDAKTLKPGWRLE